MGQKGWWARLGSNQEPVPYEDALGDSPPAPVVPCRALKSAPHLSVGFSAVPCCPTPRTGEPPHSCSNSAPTSEAGSPRQRQSVCST